MAVFAITFRIHKDNDYDQRYSSVQDAIQDEANNGWWDETTSFYLIESSKNSSNLANSVESKSDFASEKDLLVVINLSQNGYKFIGNLTDNDIMTIMNNR
ncbi:hypothetical protein LPB41_30735 [Thalassospira sp. MA62]|nr:hypothetical protein [Thalassospira sp. MA62]